MFFVPEGRDRERPDAIPLTVLANPEIEPLGAAMENDWEACLSVPGLTGRVPRHGRIRYRGTTSEGEAVERVADGFHARVRSEEHTSELQSLMRISYAVFCLKKKKTK